MAEAHDAIFPILQKIQRELGEFRKFTEARFGEISEVLLDHGDRLRKIEANTTFHRGITMQHQFEIDSLHQDVDALKARIAALEARS